MNTVNPLTGLLKLMKPTFSVIPSAVPAGGVPSSHEMRRTALTSTPDDVRNSTFSTAIPPSKFEGRPCADPDPNDTKLTSSSAFHVPCASTAPVALLCVKVPRPSASSSPGVKLPDPVIATVSPLLARETSGQAAPLSSGGREQSKPLPVRKLRVTCSCSSACATFAKVRERRMMPNVSAYALTRFWFFRVSARGGRRYIRFLIQ